ncbi:MAG: T9SS type A sorting domain-containing protein [Bacteroidetes bacterium]|nr:T9SS type A sorting domain-containing protein [Bacteroidota bacterium]
MYQTINFSAGKNNSLQTQENTKEDKVYPNPAKDKIYIQNNDHGEYILRDASGKTLVKMSVLKNSYMNVSAYPTGIYYLTNLETGKSYKIVIEK